MLDIGVFMKKINVECGIDEFDNNVRGFDFDFLGLDVFIMRLLFVVNRLDMDILDIFVGGLSYEVNMLYFNFFGKEIDIGLNFDGLEKE